MKKLIIAILIIVLSSSPRAEIVVIGRKDGPKYISKWQVERLFMGKTKTLPDGNVAVLFELPHGDENRRLFHLGYFGRSEAQLLSSWTRALFTGDAVEPTIVTDFPAMLKAVSEEANSVGYIERHYITPEVTIIHTE